MQQALSETSLTTDDLIIGFTRFSNTKQVTLQDVRSFALLTGDTNPIHMDEVFALNQGYKGPIAHGALILSLVTGLAYQLGIAKLGVVFTKIETTFSKPVYINDVIQVRIEILDRRPYDDRQDEVLISALVKNQEKKPVQRGVWTARVPKATTPQP